MTTLLCAHLFSCNVSPQQKSNETPQASETILLNKTLQLYGFIQEKIQPNILVTKTSFFKSDQRSKLVHIITTEDNFNEFNVGDDITVSFSCADPSFEEIDGAYSITDNAQIYASKIERSLTYDKPIIYIYPKEPTTCSVEVDLDGELTCAYPTYNNGWKDFIAYPDGTLKFNDGKEYYALYWEGLGNIKWDFSNGFCVRGEDTAEFLEWALATQGLTPREANEFIVYWLPLMQSNPYNVISFQNEIYSDTVELNITPTPDTFIRIFMAYYPSDFAVDIAPQSLESISRHGFTVVEWGGGKAPQNQLSINKNQ